jgi:NhaP-type Na+/H+ or K+/H+ antiporter
MNSPVKHFQRTIYIYSCKLSTMGAVLMSIVVGVVVLLLSYILIRFVKFIKWNRKMKKILSHFPGPKPHWFFGNALQVSSFYNLQL